MYTFSDTPHVGYERIPARSYVKKGRSKEPAIWIYFPLCGEQSTNAKYTFSDTFCVGLKLNSYGILPANRSASIFPSQGLHGGD